MIELTNNMATEEWYLQFSADFIDVDDMDFVYNDETQEYDEVPKDTSYIKMKYLKDIMLTVLREIDFSNSDQPTSFYLDQFKSNLQNFDYITHFSELYYKRKKREVTSSTPVAEQQTTEDEELTTAAATEKQSTAVTAVTEETTTTAVTEGQTTSTVTEEPTTAAVTEEQTTTAGTEETTTAGTEETTTAAVNEELTTSAATEEQTTTAVTEEQTTTALTEEPTTATTTEEQTTATITKEQTTTAVTEESTTAAATEEQTTATEEQTTAVVREQQTLGAETEEQPSAAVTEELKTTEAGEPTTETEEEPTTEKEETTTEEEETTTEEEETTTEEEGTTTTTMNPLIEAQLKYSEAVEKVMTVVDRMISLLEQHNSTRTKRSADVSKGYNLTRVKRSHDEDPSTCGYWYYFASNVGELRDGSVLSFAKLLVSSLFSEEQFEVLEDLSIEDIDTCGLIDKEILATNLAVAQLKEWKEIKGNDYGMNSRLDKTCIIPESPDPRVCHCECHNIEKLAIYNIYEAIRMVTSFDMQRGGDVYSWYYTDHFEQFPADIENQPRTSEPISEEIKNFEKALLHDIR